MASKAVKECTICRDEFDDGERCPRNLPCSHTICSLCITELITRDNKYCPFCLQTFEALSVSELKVNIVALDLLKYIKQIEDNSAQCCSEVLKEKKDKIDKINKRNIKSLKAARNRIRNAIKSSEKMKSKILVNHSRIKYELMSKLKSLDKSCEVKLQYIKELDGNYARLLEEIKGEIAKLKKSKDGAYAAEKCTQFEGVENLNAAAENWIEDYKEFMSRQEKAQHGLRKNIKRNSENIKSMKIVLHSSEDEDHDLIEHMAVTFLRKIPKAEELDGTRHRQLHRTSLNEMMAVQTHDGKTRYSKFSVHKNYLCLHSLRKVQELCLHSLREVQELSPNVYTVEHRDVLNLIDTSSRMAFLDIGTRESTLGRILIRLTSDTNRAQNFSLLCSGELGPSYFNTVILELWDKEEGGEYVVCGDYEYNNSLGGQALVPGINEDEGGEQELPFLAGSVGGFQWRGDAAEAQFWIMTKDDLLTSSEPMFGQVESGLHILREAVADFPSIRQVRITDCGLVLPM